MGTCYHWVLQKLWRKRYQSFYFHQYLQRIRIQKTLKIFITLLRSRTYRISTQWTNLNLSFIRIILKVKRGLCSNERYPHDWNVETWGNHDSNG